MWLKVLVHSTCVVQERAHGDFLVRLKDVMDDRQAVLAGVRGALECMGFVVKVRGAGYGIVVPRTAPYGCAQDALLEEAEAALIGNKMINTKFVVV